jgi:Phage protein (N4 Gp49/phage Sf6 gene 66) family
MEPAELEAAIAAKPGPKVTTQAMSARIADIVYINLRTVTVCSITLDNGFSVRGESACVDPANYDKQIGEALAYTNAYGKLWPLFGFLLAEILHQAKTTPTE